MPRTLPAVLKQCRFHVRRDGHRRERLWVASTVDHGIDRAHCQRQGGRITEGICGHEEPGLDARLGKDEEIL